MAVKPEDLVAPAGELEPDLFPSEVKGEDRAPLLARLAAYIADAAAHGATTDAGVKAWSYYRAYRAVYVAMSANPIRADQEGQGTAQYDKEQAVRFKDLASEWLAVFQGETQTPPTPEPKIPGTTSQRASFTW